MIQELVGLAYAPFQRTESWAANVACTALAVALWGYFLYQGVVDPLGGINTLWPLFGIANQMLAGIALVFCSVVMVKMKREKLPVDPADPDRVAADLHAHRRLAEAVPPGPEDRLHRQRPQVRRRRRARRGAGAGEVDGRHVAGDLQQLPRRRAVRAVRRAWCWRRCSSASRAALAARRSNVPTAKESDVCRARCRRSLTPARWPWTCSHAGGVRAPRPRAWHRHSRLRQLRRAHAGATIPDRDADDAATSSSASGMEARYGEGAVPLLLRWRS